MEISIWIIVFIPIIAFLYSSVGHGGASSYITLLTLIGYSQSVVKPTALIINVLISLVAFLMYIKTVEFPWKIFFWLAVFSIPATFFGAKIEVDPIIYRRILGILLLFPIARFLNLFPISDVKKIDKNILILSILGLSIGFISGLIGIGGGIILSPVLLMLGWTNLKETSAVSALFIFVNSFSGLFSMSNNEAIFAKFTNSGVLGNQMGWCIILALVGGLGGSYMGARRFEQHMLKNILTIVLLIASIKLIF